MPQVSPYTTKLHSGNAYWMARMAGAVYTTVSNDDPSPDEQAILSDLKAEDNRFLSVLGVNKNRAQAAVVEHENFICMAFRGTDEIADWLDNINAFTTDALFGSFHRGFWNSVEDVWQTMDARVRELQKKLRRPVFLTGHSLGGAMATVAAARYIHEDKPFTSAYTFGQPRAVDRSTALVFNVEAAARYFRFHNNNDIVTRVPTRLMGYSHIGSYLYISEEGVIHPEPGFWFKFVDYVDGALSAIKEDGIDAVEDHDMDCYLRAVRKWKLG